MRALQPLGVEQVAHADAAAGDLVLVGRADAAAGGADGAAAARLLAEGVEQLVPGEDDVRVVGDEQLRVVLEEAARLERVDLLHQHRGVDHHAVADDAGLPRVEDARRDQVQDGLLAAHHQRVAGVVAALEAHDDLGVLGEQVDDLALPLVAPLRSDDDDVRHSGGRLSTRPRGPSSDGTGPGARMTVSDIATARPVQGALCPGHSPPDIRLDQGPGRFAQALGERLQVLLRGENSGSGAAPPRKTTPTRTGTPSRTIRRAASPTGRQDARMRRRAPGGSPAGQEDHAPAPRPRASPRAGPPRPPGPSPPSRQRQHEGQRAVDAAAGDGGQSPGERGVQEALHRGEHRLHPVLAQVPAHLPDERLQAGSAARGRASREAEVTRRTRARTRSGALGAEAPQESRST